MRNTGTNSWQQGTSVCLRGGRESLPPENWRVELEHDVEPAQLHPFTIPVYPLETGVFTTEWQMLKEGEFWFGKIFRKKTEIFERTHIKDSLWQLFE